VVAFEAFALDALNQGEQVVGVEAFTKFDLARALAFTFIFHLLYLQELFSFAGSP
jgi:hypothetical protein